MATPIHPSQRQAIRRLYAKRFATPAVRFCRRDIARFAGVSLRTVYNVLRDVGPHGRETPPPPPKENLSLDKNWRRVRQYLKQGANPERVAETFGVTVDLIRATFPGDVPGRPDCRAKCGGCVRCLAETHQRYGREMATEHEFGVYEIEDDPQEIQARIADVWASWSDEERARRYVGPVCDVEIAVVPEPKHRRSVGAS